jgi:hypothetical protein
LTATRSWQSSPKSHIFGYTLTCRGRRMNQRKMCRSARIWKRSFLPPGTVVQRRSQTGEQRGVFGSLARVVAEGSRDSPFIPGVPARTLGSSQNTPSPVLKTDHFRNSSEEAARQTWKALGGSGPNAMRSNPGGWRTSPAPRHREYRACASGWRGKYRAEFQAGRDFTGAPPPRSCGPGGWIKLRSW